MPKFQQRTIDAFKTKLSGGGARSNLFEVSFGTPDGLPSGTFFDQIVGTGPQSAFDEGDLMLIKAAQLPASTITEIPVPFRGRTLKIAGDRTFDPWTITVINDTNFKWRVFFERWMNSITKISDGSGETNTNNYMTEMIVSQLTRGPIGALNQKGADNTNEIAVLRSYRLYGTFPTNVSAIDLSYNNENEIEEFTVDLQVQWWEAFDNAIRTPNSTSIL